MQRFVDELVGDVGTVVLGGVDMVDPELHRPAQHGQRLLAVTGRPEHPRAGELHGTEPHATHRASREQLAVLGHDVKPRDRPASKSIPGRRARIRPGGPRARCERNAGLSRVRAAGTPARIDRLPVGPPRRRRDGEDHPHACSDIIWRPGQGAVVAGPDTLPSLVQTEAGQAIFGARLLPGAGGAALGLPWTSCATFACRCRISAWIPVRGSAAASTPATLPGCSPRLPLGSHRMVRPIVPSRPRRCAS